ncbi:MAG: DNA translocase FtsK, partial [Chitinispirillaceae bacterium]
PPKIYKVPLPRVIPDPPAVSSYIDRDMIENNSQTLEKTLLNFGVEGKVINVSPGPIVTRYEIELAPGVKISKVVNLHDDLSMAVGGKKIRIQAPIPGKAAVGIELPNDEMEVVYFKHILESDIFKKSKAELPVIIGKSISGAPYVTNVRKMPHLLIAGQTGSGKSVCINSLICSLLMTRKPDELRLILIDPKKVELSIYEGIPHLMAPVVTESNEAVKALQWGVLEMTRRYRMLAKVHARNIDSFNKKIEEKSIKEGVLSEQDNKPLPFIVILVDELADLMMTASKDVEGLIQRIAQLARAVGIHLIVATQRPSVDIITGPIKANLTSRIGFRTIQSTDSRTILGHVGAEKLLGRGDMLFLRNGAPEIERFHGAFISEEDVEKIVDSIKEQQVEVEKIESFEEVMNDSPDATGIGGGGGGSDERDERFEEAARLIVSIGQGSTSLLQRRLKLGYARAGRIMDDLHNAGIVGPQEGSKMRDVLIRPEELEAYLAQLSS